MGGRRDRGVPFCRQGGRCDIMRFKSLPADVSSGALPGLFQADITASS